MTTSGQSWQLTGTTAGFLVGDWHAQRRIDDHLTGTTGWFTGHAAFQPDETEITYTERGELRLGGHVGPASRRLRYRPCGDGAAEVLFADGRPFYLLDLRAGAWEAEHQCGRDCYLVRVTATGPDAYAEHWHARGPAKDYETTTAYTRLGT
jgi:hypothetical protein